MITDPLRINFMGEKEYKDARDKELAERSIAVDLADTLKMIDGKAWKEGCAKDSIGCAKLLSWQ